MSIFSQWLLLGMRYVSASTLPLMITTLVLGQTNFDWDNYSGNGNFSDSFNWRPSGGPPGAGDTAVFDGQLENMGIGNNTVNVLSGTAIDSIQVFNSSGFPATVVDLNIGDGTTDSRFDLDNTLGNSLVVGTSAGDTPTLNLLGGWLDSWQTMVGGRGTFNILGEGSYWDATDVFVLGDTTTNTAGIGLSLGADVRNNTLDVGSDTRSGRVVVDGSLIGFGTSSLWTVSDSLDVGPTSTSGFNFGQVTLQHGGRMSVLNDASVHGTTDVPSTVTVQSGGELTVANLLRIGAYGALQLFDSSSTITVGSLTIEPGGVLNHQNGTLTVDGGAFEPGMGDFVIAGAAASDLPKLVLTSDAIGSVIGGQMVIGKDFGGEVAVENGAVLTVNRLLVGENSSTTSGSGSLTVRDDRSRLVVTGPAVNQFGSLEVGSSGYGLLTVDEQGNVEVQQGGLAIGSCFTPGCGSGEIIVDGMGSRIDTNRVGLFGTGGPSSVSIRNGGVLAANDPAPSEPNSIDLASVSISGGGSLFDLASPIQIIGASNGGSVISVTAGGTMHVGGYMLVKGQGTGGAANVIIDAAGGLPTSLEVDGSFYLGPVDTTPSDPVQLTVTSGGHARIGDSLQATAGATVALTGNGSEIHTGSFYVKPGGTFNHDDGTLIIDGGTFDPGVTDYLLEGATPSNLPVVQLTNGATASLSGTLVLIGVNQQGRMEILSGAHVDLPDLGGTLGMGGVPGSNGELLVDGKGASFTSDEGLVIGDSGHGMLQILNGGIVSNANSPFEPIGQSTGGEGLVQVIGKAVDNTPSTWTSGGEIQVGREGVGTLMVEAGGLVHSSAGAIAHSAGSTGSTAFINGIDSQWHMTGPLYLGGSSAGAGAQGTLAIANDAIVVAQDITVWAPGELLLDGGILSTGGLQLDGRLSGSGTINLGASDVLTNSGAVSPGLSPGVLTISSGDYQQSASGLLAIEIGGTSPDHYDRLHIVTGSATLAGTIEVSLIDPTGGSNIFSPNTGDTFEILTAGELAGTFNSELFPAIPGKPGLHFLIDYDTTLDRVLVSVAPYFAADFDEDGNVDGDDLAVWQANYSVGTTHMQGDADDDGDADGADFLIWQRQEGMTLGGSSMAVPERGTIVLLLFSALTAVSWRRRP